jgi:hypothetical protein
VGNFMEGPLLPARGTVTRRNGFDYLFNRCAGERVCSAGPVNSRIGRSRRNWKFRLDMHSMSMGIVDRDRSGLGAARAIIRCGP